MAAPADAGLLDSQGCCNGRSAASRAHLPLCVAVFHGGASGAAEPPHHQDGSVQAAQGQTCSGQQQHVGRLLEQQQLAAASSSIWGEYQSSSCPAGCCEPVRQMAVDNLITEKKQSRWQHPGQPVKAQLSHGAAGLCCS